MNSEKTNKTQTIIAFMIPISFGFFIGLLLARYSNPIAIASGDKTITADTKFEEIYVTIQDLCPECSDLWARRRRAL